jgi:hypothetical protein
VLPFVLKAEIYSYSRSRGLFAGISLEGSSLQVDDRTNAAYYEKEEVRPSGPRVSAIVALAAYDHRSGDTRL